MQSEFLRKTSLLILCAVLTACAGKGATPSPNAPQTARPDIGVKIGKPYQVGGQWYYPGAQADYDETGVASWYGPGFHGKYTASGERFDQKAMTAAHRTLPMPSLVRVTNLENGRSTVVRINDRGPFSKKRIIDLSESAAKAIAMTGRGTAKVRVEYLRAETERLYSSLNLPSPHGGNAPQPAGGVDVAQDFSTTPGSTIPASNMPASTQAQALPAPIAEVAQNDIPAPAGAMTAQDVAMPAPLPVGGYPARYNDTTDSATTTVTTTATTQPAVGMKPIYSTSTTKSVTTSAKSEPIESEPMAQQEEVVDAGEPVPAPPIGMRPIMTKTTTTTTSSSNLPAPLPTAASVFHADGAADDELEEAAVKPQIDEMEKEEQEANNVGMKPVLSPSASGESSPPALSSLVGMKPIISPAKPKPKPVEMADKTPAPKLAAPVKEEKVTNSGKGFYVQAGSFGVEQNAKSLADKLNRLGSTSVTTSAVGMRTWYRVRVGPVNTRKEADRLVKQINNLGVADARLVHD